MKIILAGQFNNFCLETSYLHALKDLGHEVQTYDIKKGIARHIPFGSLGKKLNTFLPVEFWIRKANRELVIMAKNFRPDLVMTFANGEIYASSLAFLKSILPVKVVLVWPDTLFNVRQHVQLAAPFYDMVASYSHSANPIFRQFGFARSEWIPLAADPYAHYEPLSAKAPQYDLTFVGGWRPEREEALAAVLQHFPSIKMRIWGQYWKRSKHKELARVFEDKPLYGKNFSAVVQQSLISMNVIDDTNYPAANMRFFEIPIAGGLQLSSACPEMENTFKNRESILYFSNKEELLEQVEFCLSNRESCREIARQAQQLVQAGHTYKHRAEQLLKLIAQ